MFHSKVFSFKCESKESLKNSLRLLLDNLSNNKLKIKDLSADLEFYSDKSFIKRYGKFYQNLSISK